MPALPVTRDRRWSVAGPAKVSGNKQKDDGRGDTALNQPHRRREHERLVHNGSPTIAARPGCCITQPHGIRHGITDNPWRINVRTNDQPNFDHHECTGDVRLLDLASQINDNHRAFLDGASRTFRVACRAGQLLLEAKRLAGHGRFESWVEQHCEFRLRQAQRYMRLAKHSEKVPDARSQDEALRLLAEILNPKASDLTLLTDATSVLVLVGQQMLQQPRLPELPFFFIPVASDFLRLLRTMPVEHLERSEGPLLEMCKFLNLHFGSKEVL